MKILNAFFILILLSSCDERFEEKEVYGYYAPIDYKNSFDTIQLQPDGLYHRKVYDKNHKLILSMNGKWIFAKDHSIKLSSYYLNHDDDLVKFPYNVNDTFGEAETYFETKNGKIQFCLGYYQGENCYYKIK